MVEMSKLQILDTIYISVLRHAILRRHQETLTRAIEEAEKSEYKRALTLHIKRAEALRDQLLKLKQFRHEVLELKPATIVELHTYANPPGEVHNTLVATYLVLGEKYRNLKVGNKNVQLEIWNR